MTSIKLVKVTELIEKNISQAFLLELVRHYR